MRILNTNIGMEHVHHKRRKGNHPLGRKGKEEDEEKGPVWWGEKAEKGSKQGTVIIYI